MADQRVIFQTKKYIPTYACEEVALCLSDDWAGTTTSGIAIIFGTLQNAGRPLGTAGRNPGVPWENVRGSEMWEYEIVYDDAQIVGADPLITCADIVDMQGGCFWHKFIDYVESV